MPCHLTPVHIEEHDGVLNSIGADVIYLNGRALGLLGLSWQWIHCHCNHIHLLCITRDYES